MKNQKPSKHLARNIFKTKNNKQQYNPHTKTKTIDLANNKTLTKTIHKNNKHHMNHNTRYKHIENIITKENIYNHIWKKDI